MYYKVTPDTSISLLKRWNVVVILVTGPPSMSQAEAEVYEGSLNDSVKCC
jgi:hypothetical protein